jgi:DNA-binding CsgD family transcriptional regulator
MTRASGDLPAVSDPALGSGPLVNLWELVRARGVVRCSFFVVPPFHSASTGQGRQFWWGYHPDWIAHYFALRGNVRDEVPDFVLDSGKAMLWDDAVKLVPRTDENQQLSVKFSSFHKSDGVCVPLYGPHGYNALMTFSLGEQLASADDPRVVEITTLANKAFAEYILELHTETIASIVLSPRELEIIALSAKGDSNKALARKLGISPASVDTYLRRIYAKLNVDDRVQAVVRCLSLGLVRL